MAVAEQTTPDEYPQTPRSPQVQLASVSFLAAWFILASLAVIFSVLPSVWDYLFKDGEGILYATDNQGTKTWMNDFLSSALLLLMSIFAMVGIGYLAYRLDKKYEQKGLRSCAFMFFVFFFGIAWIGFKIAGFLESGEQLSSAISITITAGVMAGLLFVAVKLMLSQGFQGALLALEEQGWFHAIPFKPNQGHKVRRATVVGILGLGVWGLISLIRSSTGFQPPRSQRLGVVDTVYEV